ncbi:MAG: flagellar basal body-associated protein FliL [Campylobacterales bacterium]|nr:flagellar basal body-associated protein FliL [Campylobacterales bacterium]
MAEKAKEKEGGKEKKGGSLVLIIVIVVLILIILVGAVVAILMMGGEDESASAPKAPQQQERSAEAAPTAERLPSEGSTRRNVTLSEIGPMFPLDTFTVNLLSESGRRYLKVQMNLELSGEELGVELDTKKAVIRDIIIRLLSSKALEEISTSKGKEKLKDQIVTELNMRLKDGSVNNVFFTEFVVQ